MSIIPALWPNQPYVRPPQNGNLVLSGSLYPRHGIAIYIDRLESSSRTCYVGGRGRREGGEGEWPPLDPLPLRYFLRPSGGHYDDVSVALYEPNPESICLAPNAHFSDLRRRRLDVLSASGVEEKRLSALPLGLPELLYACLLCGEADVRRPQGGTGRGPPFVYVGQRPRRLAKIQGKRGGRRPELVCLLHL